MPIFGQLDINIEQSNINMKKVIEFVIQLKEEFEEKII